MPSPVFRVVFQAIHNMRPALDRLRLGTLESGVHRGFRPRQKIQFPTRQSVELVERLGACNLGSSSILQSAVMGRAGRTAPLHHLTTRRQAPTNQQAA